MNMKRSKAPVLPLKCKFPRSAMLRALVSIMMTSYRMNTHHLVRHISWEAKTARHVRP
jgi:hypothetical protein